MKDQFLRALNRELQPLKKEERKKYLANYEEIILDKMDNGMTEENAVTSLGNVKQISKEILNTYADPDGRMLFNNLRHFNNIYMVIDAIVLTVSYLLAYYLRFKSGFLEVGSWSLPLSRYLFALVYIIPCFFVLYFVFKLYTVTCVQNHLREAATIFLSNVLGIMVFFLVLYVSKQIDFSRMMIIIFVCINIILEIVLRNVIRYYFGNFLVKS